MPTKGNNGYIFCSKCGTKNVDTNTNCSSCGNPLQTSIKNEQKIACPNCGSDQIEFVTYQASSSFDKGDACCGYLLCGPLGLLCGAKDQIPAHTVRKCKNCGHEF